MHFWIDKRSSYGIGHNRSMAGLTYQQRRKRSTSIVIPFRQHPTSVPSSAPPKSQNLSHHRNRNIELDRRSNSTRIPHQQQPNPESSAAQSQSVGLNSHHVPVVHSVYLRDEFTTSHQVRDNTSLESSRVNDNWLPIYLKGGICVTTAIILLMFKIYHDNELTGLQLVTFGSMSLLVFFIFTMTITVLRMKRNGALPHHGIQSEFIITPVINEPVLLNQINNTQPADDESNDFPPPYAVAVKLAEKHSIIDFSPPPSYEKIYSI